jgi:hypothetical protein
MEIFQFFMASIHGHARLRKPPSRASMWRDGYNTPPDWTDNEGYCGGLVVLFEFSRTFVIH